MGAVCTITVTTTTCGSTRTTEHRRRFRGIQTWQNSLLAESARNLAFSIHRVPEATAPCISAFRLISFPLFAYEFPFAFPLPPGHDESMWEITEADLAAHAEWLNSGGTSGKRMEKPGRNLSGHSYPGIRADQARFIGTNFTDADLTGVSFISVDCSGARFNGANLTRADLRGADLGGVLFDGANLTEADLTGADLSGASLQNANLTRANFTEADLIAANLTGAIQTGMCVAGAKLNDTRGLV